LAAVVSIFPAKTDASFDCWNAKPTLLRLLSLANDTCYLGRLQQAVNMAENMSNGIGGDVEMKEEAATEVRSHRPSHRQHELTVPRHR